MASDDEILAQPVSQKTSPVTLFSDNRTKYDILSQVAVRPSPRVNCPEKIVICLDLSAEMDTVVFKSRSGDKFPPLKIVKRAISIFVWSKHRIDERHEFAIVVMANDGALWVMDFTNNPRDVTQFLEGVNHCFEYSGDRFDLTAIFDQTLRRVTPPIVEPGVAPPFVLRFLIFYGRSHCLPEIENQEMYNVLRATPQCFIDVFYVHDPPAEDNKCAEVFDRLCSLDEDGLSYIFEVSRNLTKVYDYIAQLVAHPLQRPLQRDACYKLKAVET